MRRSITRNVLVLAAIGSAGTASAAVGNLKVSNPNGKLVLKGGSVPVGVTIDQAGLGADAFRIQPDAFSTVNGSSSALVVTGITGGVEIHFEKGADALILQDATLPENLKLIGGAGDDAIDFHHFVPATPAPAVGGNFVINGGGGELTLNVSADLAVTGNLAIQGGAGSDSVAIDGVTVDTNASVLLKSGDSSLSIGESSIAGSLLCIGSGNFADSVDLSGTPIGGALELLLEGGANDLFVQDCTVGAGLFYDQNDTTAGVDDIHLFTLTVNGPTLIDLDKGNDSDEDSNQLSISGSSHFDSMRVRGGTGVDDVTISAATMDQLVELLMKSGNNVVKLKTSTLNGSLSIVTLGGDDTIDTTGTTVAGTTHIDAGAGANSVTP